MHAYIQRTKPRIVGEMESELILRYGVSGRIKIQEINEIIKFSKKCTLVLEILE